MKTTNLLMALVPALLLLGGCSSVDDLLGKDTGRVRLSCAGSAPAAGVPDLKTTLSPLAPGAKLEITKPAPQPAVLLTMPEGAAGDQFGYSWKEADTGPGRPPGIWMCRAGWQYDGRFWQLSQMDAQWVGGVER